MYTPNKRRLRRLRFFLPSQETFALFNKSAQKTSEVHVGQLSLQNAQLYHAPLFLSPPKIALGCPLMIVIYESLEDLRQNVPEVASELDCLGVSIEGKWYSVQDFNKDSDLDLNRQMLALMLLKNKED